MTETLSRQYIVAMILPSFASLILVSSATLATSITWKDRAISMSKRMAIYKNHAFLAYRRFEAGTDGVTLTRMCLTGKKHKQHPFPNWAMQKSGECSALQDVVDIFIDPKGILWVLDAAGRTIFSTACPPKIVAFNATTGEVTRTIDLSNNAGGWRDISTFSRIVVDYNREDQPLVYVSRRYYREIFVISRPSCVHAIALPNSAILDKNSNEISLNLVRKNNYSLLLINDERREKMFYLRLDDVPACSKLPRSLLHNLGSNNNIILGNELSTVYYQEKSNRAVIYKYDALNRTVPSTVAYDGNPSTLVHHVVPDHTRGGMRLLESNTVIRNNSNVDVVSLKLI